MSETTVAVVGAGVMGGAMAGQLVRAGFSVRVHDREPARVEPLVAAGAAAAELEELRVDLRDKLGAATTLGYGPRFLHSTGQLHKGGPNTGMFLQIVDTPTEPLPVPTLGFTFAELVAGQALGDYQALRGRDRRVLRVAVGTDVLAGLLAIDEALRG